MPSLGSGVATLLIAVFLAATSLWDFLRSVPFLHDYFFALRRNGEMIAERPDASSGFSKAVLASPLVNNLLLIAFWAVVGIASYLILSAFINASKDASRELQATRYIDRKRLAGVSFGSYLQRVMLRVLIAVSWLVYAVIFISFLAPVAMTNIRYAVSLGLLENWLAFLSGFVVLLLGLHLHVVFLRLFLLRSRVTS